MTIQEEQCRIKNCQFRSRSKATACIVTLLCVPMSVCQAGFALPATPPREVLLLRSRNHLPALIDSRIRTFHQSTRIRMSSEVDDEFRNNREPSSQPKADEDSDQDVTAAPVQKMLSSLQDGWKSATKLPPIQVDDANVLFYDIFLLINLTVSYVQRPLLGMWYKLSTSGCDLTHDFRCADYRSGRFTD